MNDAPENRCAVKGDDDAWAFQKCPAACGACAPPRTECYVSRGYTDTVFTCRGDTELDIYTSDDLDDLDAPGTGHLACDGAASARDCFKDVCSNLPTGDRYGDHRDTLPPNVVDHDCRYICFYGDCGCDCDCDEGPERGCTDRRLQGGERVLFSPFSRAS